MSTDKIKKMKRIKELIEILNKASYEYYQLDNPSMSDKEYDALYDELEKLEKFTGLVLSNSPTQKVQGFILDGLSKVKHRTPMLSANKTKDMDEIKKFIGNRSVLGSFKLDGLTLVVKYFQGEFQQAITRGNGEIGEDLTEQAKMISNLPMRIPYQGHLELRGECVISWDNFNKLNAKLKEPFSHPRNAAAGSIRQLDTRIIKERNLEYIVFNLVHVDSIHFTAYKNQELNWLDTLGFTTVDRICLPSSGNDLSPCFNDSLIANDLESMDEYLSADRSIYPVDGQIYEYDNLDYARNLGSTSHHPLNLIARKWADETYETVLRDVEWKTTRTGIISAVAVFDEVDLDGAATTKATLHNLSFIENLELGIGDTITVYRANMVIPAIDENLTRSNSLEIPKVCPSCGSPTEIKQDGKAKFLYCTNDECESKLLHKLIHFVERESMNIDGLSEATLETLLNLGYINTAADIYHLSKYEKDIAKISGFGKKSVEKILAAIEESRNTTMDRFIRALGINLIGRSASKDLAKFCNEDIKTFNQHIVNHTDFSKEIDGFGDKMNKSIHDWFKKKENRELYKEICKELKFKAEEKTTNKSSVDLTGMSFVITGSLNHFKSRDELKVKLESLGAKVSGSVSSKTTALICNEDSNSSKSKKAKELGVSIWSEVMLIEYMNGNVKID